MKSKEEESEFNVNGTVQINNIGVDPSSGLVQLPANVTDSSQQIATGCSNNTASSFVSTGRGGIPQNPTQDVRSYVYDGLRLRLSIYTHNRVFEFRSGIKLNHI